jgi:hypothetical protein
MSETAARELHSLVDRMNAAFMRSSGDKALVLGKLGSDFAELIAEVIGLVRDTREDIVRAEFPTAQRADDLLERLDAAQKAIINALAKRGGGNTNGALVSEVIVERLLSIAEQVENAGISGAASASREDMIRETEALIADVKAWDLEDYAKRALLLQLNNVARVIQASDTYSTADLRLRVKAIIADFASEFAQMDKKHQTQLERLVLWARRGFFAGTVLLGLTADVATITAALPAPPRLLGSG